MALSELAEIPRQLAAAAGTSGVRTLLTGRQPTPERCAALRAAGYALALWDPIHDGTLRYQLNLAVGAPGRDPPRVAPRVPTPLVARVRRPDRETEAGVYNLSATGAYLETPRPSARGAKIELDLRLPSGHISLRAAVTHANVPGNLRRSLLPIGMGVHFEGMTKEIEAALRAYLALRAQELKV
jgi:hypothetical protein